MLCIYAWVELEAANSLLTVSVKRILYKDCDKLYIIYLVFDITWKLSIDANKSNNQS